MIKKVSTGLLLNISMLFMVLFVTIVFTSFLVFVYKPLYSVKSIETQNLVSQFKENFELIINNVIQVGNILSYDTSIQALLNEKRVEHRIEYIREADKITEALLRSVPDIVTISLKVKDSVVNLYAPQEFSEYILMNEIYNDYTEGIKVYQVKNKNYYCYIKPVFDINAAKPTKIGDIFVLSDMDSIQALIDKMKFSKQSVLSLAESNGKIIASNRKEMINTLLDFESERYHCENINKTDLRIAYKEPVKKSL